MKTEPPWTNEFNLFMFPVRSLQAREVMSMLKTTQHTEGLGWDLNLSLGAQPKLFGEGEGGKRRRKEEREEDKNKEQEEEEQGGEERRGKREEKKQEKWKKEKEGGEGEGEGRRSEAKLLGHTQCK